MLTGAPGLIKAHSNAPVLLKTPRQVSLQIKFAIQTHKNIPPPLLPFGYLLKNVLRPRNKLLLFDHVLI